MTNANRRSAAILHSAWVVTALIAGSACAQVQQQSQADNVGSVYSGNHGNRIPQRVEMKVLPFFSQHLEKARDERKR